jgi:hypothetical protein
MKDLVKRLHSYLAFDQPMQMDVIRSKFSLIHGQQQKIIREWSAASTRQKLVARYWYIDVLGHFVALICLPLLITLTVEHTINSHIVAVLFLAAMLSFLIMLCSHYLPGFTHEFLPNLETVKNSHDVLKQEAQVTQLRHQLELQKEEIIQQQKAFEVRLQRELSEQESRLLKQQERTQRKIQEQAAETRNNAEQQQEELKKCRQAQLSNFALTLVFYVWTRSAGINGITPNDQNAQLLQQLYGVDRGSLRNNLELISGTASKRKNLGERKLTEMRNRFEEAEAFFKQLNYPQGVSMLKELENKILGNS